MRNRTIAILLGWVLTIYFAVIILRNTSYMYNLIFLLVLAFIYNIFMINIGEDEPLPKKSKQKKTKKKKK